VNAHARILLLRGINLGPSRRVSMPDLRSTLDAAGYGAARTYVQSGNIVLSSDRDPADLESSVAALITQRFGFEVPVVARTGRDLDRIVEHDPLGELVTEPKAYGVSFLSGPLSDEVVTRLHAAVAPDERVVIDGREVYAWHPHGVARSKLWNALGGKGLGIIATTRNWTTVRALRTMAEQIDG
jgi:uncharacterized protein (DUF1697 family)